MSKEALRSLEQDQMFQPGSITITNIINIAGDIRHSKEPHLGKTECDKGPDFFL